MTAPLLSELREPPVVGRFYMVPAIEFIWNDRPGLWPILGPKHEDREFFNFPYPHYHLDLRFLAYQQERFVAARGKYYYLGQRRSRTGPVFSGSMLEIAASTWPLNRRQGNGEEMTPHPRPQLVRRKCRRDSFVFAAPFAKPVIEMATRFGRPADPIRTKDGKILCPHRKLDLSQFPPGPDGTVICPLHGLRVRCAA